jgi:hypothetical protein
MTLVLSQFVAQHHVLTGIWVEQPSEPIGGQMACWFTWKDQNAERELQSLTEVLEKSSTGVCSTEASADPVATSTTASTQPENNCKDIGGGERGQKRQSEIVLRLGV